VEGLGFYSEKHCAMTNGTESIHHPFPSWKSQSFPGPLPPVPPDVTTLASAFLIYGTGIRNRSKLLITKDRVISNLRYSTPLKVVSCPCTKHRFNARPIAHFLLRFFYPAHPGGRILFISLKTTHILFLQVIHPRQYSKSISQIPLAFRLLPVTCHSLTLSIPNGSPAAAFSVCYSPCKHSTRRGAA
jgi:hypothetical protein